MQHCSLNYTVFFLVSQHIGTRGRQEHHQIWIEDLKKNPRPNMGQKCHSWKDWRTYEDKTRWSSQTSQNGGTKLYRTGSQRCPIAVYELLISKHPPELRNVGPLYLAPLRKERDWSKAPEWFSKSPTGVHSIDTFVNKMAISAGLDATQKHFTNLSIHKTTVIKLKRTGMCASGHKNQQSIADYHIMTVTMKTTRDWAKDSAARAQEIQVNC